MCTSDDQVADLCEGLGVGFIVASWILCGEFQLGAWRRLKIKQKTDLDDAFSWLNGAGQTVSAVRAKRLCSSERDSQLAAGSGTPLSAEGPLRHQ